MIQILSLNLFQFDVDPDPESALLNKKDPDIGHEHFFVIYWFFNKTTMF